MAEKEMEVLNDRDMNLDEEVIGDRPKRYQRQLDCSRQFDCRPEKFRDLPGENGRPTLAVLEGTCLPDLRSYEDRR